MDAFKSPANPWAPLGTDSCSTELPRALHVASFVPKLVMNLVSQQGQARASKESDSPIAQL